MFDVRHADWNKPRTPCVCVVESPNAEDLLRDCQEGRALQAALHQARIPCRHYLATNKATFAQALGFIAQQRPLDEQQIALHISCHGNTDGIALTSGEFKTWAELRPELVDFARQALAYDEAANLSTVLLCMSACSGLAASEMATATERPFLALVAPSQPVSWSDCLVSFLTFYNLFLVKQLAIADSVFAMNAAVSSPGVFQVIDLSADIRRRVR